MTCRIVAELSCNHEGKLERALALVDAVADAGAHAVKIQTWTPGSMVLDRTLVLRNGPWVGTNLFELYERAQTPEAWIAPIFARARERGIECFASVFDIPAIRELERLGCPRYKVASFELMDLPLIKALVATKKPLILSTGMATSEEIDMAVGAARDAGCRDLTLLKCTSAYPADGSSANLATMRAMAQRWSVNAGLSDHTPGVGVAIAAAALGADMIEKHFTLWRAEGGFDAKFSIEAPELKLLVEECARVEKALGSATQYGATEHEKPQLELRRSLYFAQDLAPGTYIGEEHVTTARPARGISPRLYWRVLGAKVLMGVKRGQPVQLDHLELKKPAFA